MSSSVMRRTLVLGVCGLGMLATATVHAESGGASKRDATPGLTRRGVASGGSLGADTPPHRGISTDGTARGGAWTDQPPGTRSGVSDAHLPGAAPHVGTAVSADTFAAQACTPEPVVIRGLTYYQCGARWYQPVYANGALTYVVVYPPNSQGTP